MVYLYPRDANLTVLSLAHDWSSPERDWACAKQESLRCIYWQEQEVKTNNSTSLVDNLEFSCCDGIFYQFLSPWSGGQKFSQSVPLLTLLGLSPVWQLHRYLYSCVCSGDHRASCCGNQGQRCQRNQVSQNMIRVKHWAPGRTGRVVQASINLLCKTSAASGPLPS